MTAHVVNHLLAAHFNGGPCCCLVGDLKSLSILELENNCLEALPESFGKLRRLEYLTLDHNRLRVGHYR
jgi:hypothetical protein